MSCCCKKNEPKVVAKKNQCCVCNPFDQDGTLMTAQIASIIAVCISWVWWPVFVLAAPIVAILQITWCCQMRKRGLIMAVVLSVLACVGSLVVGIWISTQCWSSIFVVFLNNDDNYSYNDDFYNRHCQNYYQNNTAWAIVAFVDALLFLTTAVFTAYFVLYRYDAISEKKRLLRQQQEEEVIMADTGVHAVEMTAVAALSMATPEATAAVMPPYTKDIDNV